MGGIELRQRPERRPGLMDGWKRFFAVALAMVAGSTAFAAPPSHDTPQGTGSKEARQSAIQSIPYDQLDAAAQDKVRSVLANVTMFRRMPIRTIESDSEMYLFLLRHPDVVVNIWQVLGLSQLEMRQIDEGTFQFDDHGGTVGTAEIIYQSPKMHIVYAQGHYQGPPLLRQANGRAILILTTEYSTDPSGRSFATTRMDSFLNIDHHAVEFFAKTFEPIVGKVADANFTQSVAFVSSMSLSAQANPGGIERLSKRLLRVDPELRTELAAIARRSATREWSTAAQPTASVAR